MGGIPNMENIQDHLKTLFEGKIGTLAKEIAEEVSGEFSDLLGEDTSELHDTKDVIKKLMKNPKKIMDLMKKVSSKLDNKMKNGEISKEEIMKEAGDLIGKMKDMGGQDQFNEMFKNLAKNMGMGMGKNMKLDTNALDRMTKQQAMKERMRNKLEIKKQKQAEELEKMKERARQQMENSTKYSLESNNENSFVFRLDGEETQQKSYKTSADAMAEMLIAEEEAEKSNMKNDNSQMKKKKKKSKK